MVASRAHRTATCTSNTMSERASLIHRSNAASRFKRMLHVDQRIGARVANGLRGCGTGTCHCPLIGGPAAPRLVLQFLNYLNRRKVTISEQRRRDSLSRGVAA